MKITHPRILARVAFLIGVGVLLALGLAREKHALHPITPQGSTTMRTGGEFISDATIDRYMLREGKLIDVYSLSGNILGIKDCKT